MLTTATKRKIDTARDILVGKIPVPTSQVEQITLALVYKFMSDMDKKAKDLGDSSGFFANGYEKYAWGKLMDKALPARDRVLLYREALEKMSLNPHIPQLFRDVFRDASLPFNDPETLKLFLDVIDQFEYDHSEELGNAFEYLLQVMGSQGDAGQFRTPRHIIDFIVDVVEPSKTDKILDPACGTAGFLISAYNHIKKNGLSSEEMTQLSENFVGYDISQDMQRLSLVNMYLHHFPNPHIYEYDTLTSEDRWNDDFDVILANPPFMTPKGGIRPHNRFSVPSKRAEVLFVDYIMEHLTARGKAGVIVPEGIIFQSQGAYTQLRKMMVEGNYLWAVVSLPGGIFNPYSGVKTSILLFDREIAKKTDKILFVKVNSDGFDLGAQRRETDRNDLPIARELLLKFKHAILSGKELSLDTVLELGGGTSDKNMMSSYGFDLNANSHIELEQIINIAYNEIEKHNIKDDYVLSSEKYKASKLKTALDYESVLLGDACDIFNGSTPSRKDESFWVDGTIPWFTIQDIREQGRLIGHTKEKITQKALNQTSVKLLPKNTVLLCCTASIGEYAFTEIPLTTNQQFNGLVVKDEYKNKLLPKFLFWISSTFKDELERISGKTSFGFVSVSNLRKLVIPLPPISLQQEFVEKLDQYQKVIDGAKQVVHNYQVNFEVKDSWKKLNFENSPIQILDGDRGTNYPGKKDLLSEGFCLFLNTKNVRPDGFRFDELEFVDQKRDQLLGKGRLKRNDVVLTTRGTIGNVGLYSIDIQFEQIRINSGMVILRPDNSAIHPEFLFYFLQSTFFRTQVQEMVSGSAQPQLPIRSIKQIQVVIPPLDEQKSIVNQIKNEKQLVHSTAKIIELYEQKISGKIDGLWNNET